jgi:signal transduction histidine kinase
MTSTESANPSTGANDDASGSARPLVWILDDSPMEGAMARRALAPRYEVQTFLDGSTLLERMATGACPDVLVLDWHLPGMSGIEVCRFLRATRDEMALPILMLTVYGHKSDLVDGLNAGANDYLTKPYDAPELAARVDTLARINMLNHKARHAERRSAELLERERVARREAEAANRAKDDFLAMVSHELRTPLNAILGWARMLRSGTIPADKIEKALATVERNAIAQTRLIEDLMDMSRILSGKLTIEPQPIEFVSVVQAAVETVRPAAESKGITLHLNSELDAGDMEGDPARLQQMIWNLLTNAIKFTPTGGSVVVGLDRIDAHIRLSVVDSGSGIDSGFLPHVFKRFRQGNVGSKRVHSGLGLGLALVKHVAELHQGSVEARSAGPGKGATFVVLLPCAGRASQPARPAGDPSIHLADVAGSTRLAGLRVLVVDDDPDALELFGALLRRHGSDVVLAQSASQALEAIAESRFDVIVSDVAMPDRDGHDMMRAVRALPRESGGRVPALALSAFAAPHDRTRALQAGFNLYAAKPVDPAELIVSVASLAGRYEG